MWDLSFPTRDRTYVPCICKGFLTTGPPRKSPNPWFLTTALHSFPNVNIHIVFVCSCKHLIRQEWLSLSLLSPPLFQHHPLIVGHHSLVPQASSYQSHQQEAPQPVTKNESKPYISVPFLLFLHENNLFHF